MPFTTRSRNRQLNTCYSKPGLAYCDFPSGISYPFEHFMSERVKKGVTNIRHSKCLYQRSGTLGRFVQDLDLTMVNWFPRADNHHSTLSRCEPYTRAADSAFRSMLSSKWDNNEFELIPFLTDLDATLASWWSRLTSLRRQDYSYGAFTWDILPFISDLKSLFMSLRDICTIGERPFCQRVSRQRLISGHVPHDTSVAPDTWGWYVSTFYGVCRFSGYIVYTPPKLSDKIGTALFLLDELGVHPDLKTVWDVIPLSFVVDYFLPIGSILESLHPRGWSDCVTFEGYTSIKLSGQMAYSYRKGTAQQFGFVPHEFRYYSRNYSGSHTRPTQAFEWKSPSFLQIFNTAYLVGALKRFF